MSQPPTPTLRDRESTRVTRARVTVEVRRSVRPLTVYVAFLGVAIFCGAVLLSKMVAQTPFGDYYRVGVLVDDAKGVVGGQQEVRLAGVPVGLIQSVSLDERRPRLTISIERKYGPLFRDARLRLRPATPLSDLYLDIESRGTVSAGELPGDGLLAAERTRVPVDISRVLDLFDQPTRQRLNSLIDGFGQGMSDNGAQLRATLVELTPFLDAAKRLTAETADRDRMTRRLVHNFRLVTGELARRDGQLTVLVSSGETTFRALSETGRPLGSFLEELAPMLTQLRSAAGRADLALEELEPALVALEPTSRALAPALSSLGSTAIVARPAFAGLRRAVEDLSPLLNQARPTARALRSAFGRLRPTAPRLDYITAAITPCEFVLQKFFAWTASVLKFRDELASYPRAEAVPGQHQYVDGASCAPDGPGA